MTDQELLNLKKELELAKQKLSEAKGKKKGLLETLEKKFGCKSIKEAEKKLAELTKEADRLEKQKQEGIKELEENYEF